MVEKEVIDRAIEREQLETCVRVDRVVGASSKGTLLTAATATVSAVGLVGTMMAPRFLRGNLKQSLNAGGMLLSIFGVAKSRDAGEALEKHLYDTADIDGLARSCVGKIHESRAKELQEKKKQEQDAAAVGSVISKFAP